MKDYSSRILFVDSERRWSKRITVLIERSGFELTYASDLDEAAEVLAESIPEILVLGFADPGLVHSSALQNFLDSASSAFVIGLLGELSEDYEPILRRAGIEVFLPRAMPPHRIARVIAGFAELSSLDAENRRLRQLLECQTAYEFLLGGSAPMRALYRLVDQVSHADAPVFITGEGGSEFIEVARSVHQRSDRADYPFIVVRCSEGSPEAVENELFGPQGDGVHPLGPATSGSAFARADQGSLILENVEALSRSSQKRLISFFRAPFFQGETAATPQPIARIVATSSADLVSLVDEGTFLRELYYRLKILHVAVPPLRDRREDIPMLAEHFLREAQDEAKPHRSGPAPTFSGDAMLQLYQYAWPGNLDELAESIRIASSRTKSYEIETEHLPAKMLEASSAEEKKPGGGISATIPLREAKHIFEAAYFNDLLRRTGGNMTMASRLSKVGRPYLYKKLKEHEIEPETFRGERSPRIKTPS